MLQPLQVLRRRTEVRLTRFNRYLDPSFTNIKLECHKQCSSRYEVCLAFPALVILKHTVPLVVPRQSRYSIAPQACSCSCTVRSIVLFTSHQYQTTSEATVTPEMAKRDARIHDEMAISVTRACRLQPWYFWRSDRDNESREEIAPPPFAFASGDMFSLSGRSIEFRP